MSFKDKVVIVTGASSGIGAATAIAFTSEGAKVVMVGRNQAKLKDVAKQCEQKGSKPLVITADVSENVATKRIVNETLDHFGKLDILVNNAGMYVQTSILDPNVMEMHEKLIATNLQSAVHLTHLAAPHLVQTKGNIVNVSSIASRGIIVDESFSYATSKAALDHFTRAVALELAHKGVRANVVNPGIVRTDMIDNNEPSLTKEQKDSAYDSMAQLTPLKRIGEPEEIADLILFLASDKARSITGSSFVSDNGSLFAGLIKNPMPQ